MEREPGVRRYTDREVRLILKSAVELQQQGGDGEPSSGGLSLAELEQVAAEAGIDPAVVRRAAGALDAAGAPDGANPFLGGPTEVVVERIVDVPVDASDFEGLLGALRARTRQLGESSTVGRQFGWHGRVDGARTEVSVGPAGAGSRALVRVRVELDEQALGHFMLKGTLFGVGGGLASATAAAMAFGPVGLLGGVAVAAGGYLWARRGFQKAVGRFRGRAQELATALAEALAAPQARTQTDVATGSAASASGDRYSTG